MWAMPTAREIAKNFSRFFDPEDFMVPPKKVTTKVYMNFATPARAEGS
jgi:hypothetical protein